MLKNILIITLTLLSLNTFAQVDRSHAPEANIPSDINLGDLKTVVLDNGLEVFLVPKPGYGKFAFSMTVSHPDFTDEVQSEVRQYVNKIYYTADGTKYTHEEADSIKEFAGAKVAATINGGFAIGLREDLDMLMDVYTDKLFDIKMTQESIDSFIVNGVKDQEKLRLNPKKKKTSFSIVTHLKDSILNSNAKSLKEPKSKLDYDYSLVTLESVNDFHKKRIVANHSTAILIGDFTEKSARKMLNKYFGDWQQGPDYHETEDIREEPGFIPTRQIAIVDKPEAVQSSISLHWNLGDSYSYTETTIPLMVMNQVLGGYTMSYIYNNLRDQKGLCYYAFSSICSGVNGGTGFVKTEVRTAKTSLAIENILYEMLRIRNQPVSEETLKMAQSSLIGKHARSLSGIALQQFLSFSMVKDDFDLPDDYLKTLSSKIGQVTAEQVAEMANKYVKPNTCLIIIEGDAKKLKEQGFDRFGATTYYNKDGKILEME